MPQAAIAQATATAAMPTLSAQYARQQFTELAHSLDAALRGVLLLSLPAALGLIFLRYPIVSVLYQRGRFTQHSTDLVAWALLWFAAGLVGHCMVEVLARAFYAMQDTRTPVLVGGAAMVLNVLMSFAFTALFLQLGWAPHGGLALANSLATALEMLGLWVWMRRRLSGWHESQVMPTLRRSIFASLLMAGGLWAWLGWSAGLSTWIVLPVSLALGVGLYSLGLLLQGTPELRQGLSWLRQRLARLGMA